MSNEYRVDPTVSRNPEERYRHDVMFRNLVDLLELQIIEAQLTPTEIREAAMLAAIHYEERHQLRRRIFLDQIRP